MATAATISINSSGSSSSSSSSNSSQGSHIRHILPRRLLSSPFGIVLAALLICSLLLALFCLYPWLLSTASSSSYDIISVKVGSSSGRKFSCFNFLTRRSKVTEEGGGGEDDEVEDGEPYKLFGTKTTYLNARQEIRKVLLPEGSTHKQHPHKAKKSKKKSSGKHWWPPLPLPPPAEEHSNDEGGGCSPHYFYFLNRHSIRYPSVKEIRRFAALLPPLRAELLAGGRLQPSTFRALFSWRLLMSELDENHVSMSGRLETAVTAQIFYQYFPSLLDINSVHFEVGVTPKVRTTETADAFIRSLVELQLKSNAGNASHQEQQQQLSQEQLSAGVEEIIRRKFHPLEEKPLLMTHKTCKRMLEERQRPPPKHPPEYYQFAGSEAFIQLLLRFSERNGLRVTLNFDSLVLVYRACSYELAIHRHSPWCALFTGAELQVLDYLMDISEYFDAYGTEAHRKLACTVISDLYRKLEQLTTMTTTSNQAAKNATLYFSHENLLSKVISFFGLLDHFPPHHHPPGSEQICLPADGSRWRSSLLVPFGTNFAAVLYRCPVSSGDDPAKEGASEAAESPSSTWKLLTLLNEVPVVVRGCSAALCPLEQFFAEYRQWTVTEEACDLNEICV